MSAPFEGKVALVLARSPRDIDTRLCDLYMNQSRLTLLHHS